MVMTDDGINTRRDHAQIPSSILRGGDLGAEVVMTDDVLSWCRYLYEMCAQPMIVINVADKGKADNMIGKLHHELRQTQQLQFDMTSSSGEATGSFSSSPRAPARDLQLCTCPKDSDSHRNRSKRACQTGGCGCDAANMRVFCRH